MIDWPLTNTLAGALPHADNSSWHSDGFSLPCPQVDSQIEVARCFNLVRRRGCLRSPKPVSAQSRSRRPHADETIACAGSEYTGGQRLRTDHVVGATPGN